MRERRILRATVGTLVLAVAVSTVAMGDVALTFNFTDLGPHVGQALSLRVVDVATWAEVARVTVPEVLSGELQVDVSPFVEGKTYQVDHYNLDAILSVGYRVNSIRRTRFRIWATDTLRQHLLSGFTLNERRLRETGLAEMEQTVGLLARTQRVGLHRFARCRVRQSRRGRRGGGGGAVPPGL